ncbi:hypothetical protein DFQ04_0725 [Algoriphagus boseongensis]|uniref:YtxH-like protein n=1 Tax=Algoriphagus boseongensis TaxID=1442587 RepID=A0A4R6TBS2_9BACT|nr:hypothetical protein [Algoriphagus boseongensis]TDQ18914.1 hypothetical protein DFQ04_0725 [Algoriphagus boseongensis]
MTTSNKKLALWLGGLATGIIAGTLIYQNREKLEPNKNKFNKLLSDWQKSGEKLKNKLVEASKESIERGKKLSNAAVESMN